MVVSEGVEGNQLSYHACRQFSGDFKSEHINVLALYSQVSRLSPDRIEIIWFTRSILESLEKSTRSIVEYAMLLSCHVHLWCSLFSAWIAQLSLCRCTICTTIPICVLRWCLAEHLNCFHIIIEPKKLSISNTYDAPSTRGTA